MSSSAHPDDKRRYKRARVNLLTDCSARLDEPAAIEGIIEDLSQGGVRMACVTPPGAPAPAKGADVRGEIVSDNPALQMFFSGKIVWLADALEDGQRLLRIGIAFAPDVVLSEVLYSLPKAKSAEAEG